MRLNRLCQFLRVDLTLGPGKYFGEAMIVEMLPDLPLERTIRFASSISMGKIFSEGANGSSTFTFPRRNASQSSTVHFRIWANLPTHTFGSAEVVASTFDEPEAIFPMQNS